jgi:fatty acid desaturase
MSANAVHGVPNAVSVASRVNRLRRIDNHTNAFYLLGEYLSMALVISVVVGLCYFRGRFGLSWAWDLPVLAIGWILMGALQHRLAGLGHEAAHYTLFHNKFANDLVGDLLCMFPVLATVHFYRVFHLAHHQYTNDPERDPDLVNLGRSKRLRDYPMPRWRCVVLTFFRWLSDPLSVLGYQSDYLYLNLLGKGGNIYMRRVPEGDGNDPRPRPATVLGLAYVAGWIALTWWLTKSGHGTWLLPCTVGALGLTLAGSLLVPRAWLFHSPFRQVYGPRFASAIRLAYYTVFLSAFSYLRLWTGGWSTLYTFALWFIPLGTSFTYFMLLRDVYQHTNADTGKLTNTRVFYPDPFTRWAVFVYGQDVHLTHHLHPAVPHYHLEALHRLLIEEDPEYARTVVECHGTFRGDGQHPTILDVLSLPAP